MISTLLLIVVVALIYRLLFMSLGMDDFSKSDDSKARMTDSLMRWISRISGISGDTNDRERMGRDEEASYENISDDKKSERAKGNVEQFDGVAAGGRSAKIIDVEVISTSEAMLSSDLRAKIRELRNIDTSFDLDAFLDKVGKVIKVLYESVVSQDKDALSALCGGSALTELSETLSYLQEEEATMTSSVTVRDLEVVGVEFNRPVDDVRKDEKGKKSKSGAGDNISTSIVVCAKIAILSYTTGKDGALLRGSSEHIQEKKENYTFMRSNIHDKAWLIVNIEKF